VFISTLKIKITGITMVLTKDFKETVGKIIDRDPEFAKESIRESFSGKLQQNKYKLNFMCFPKTFCKP
jgi:hypothetical protein